MSLHQESPPAESINVGMWEYCTLHGFLDMARFIPLTPLPLIVSCKLLVITVSNRPFENIFLPTSSTSY
jgi:hypothetical protein